MNDIESRLRDALSARADLVQPEDLTPPAAPAVEPPPWFRRPTALLAAAAVAVLLIVLPLAAAINSDDSGGTDPVESPSEAPTETNGTDGTDRGGAPWWEQPLGTWNEPELFEIGERQRGLTANGESFEAWLEEDGSGGLVLKVRFPGKPDVAPRELTTPVSAGVRLGPLTSVSGSAEYVIPVVETQGAAGTTYSGWQVWLIRGDELVQAELPEEPYLGQQTSNLTEEEGGTDTWRTWVHPETGELSTMAYDEGTPIDDEAYPGEGLRLYRNTLYRWQIDGDRLSAEKVGTRCSVRTDTLLYACP